jgi:HEAT repeat protein
MGQPTENLTSRDAFQDMPMPGPPTPPDLPPVEAPSAGFIVQLFVIPAVVVAVVVVVWLLFGKLAGGERDAREYVRLLRSPDANWRAAFELASLIQNDATLASDPVLLGELTDLLAHDLDRPDHDPKLTQYVALTLGAFHTLEARTAAGRAVDPIAVLARASAAAEPPAVRMAAVASLAKHAARLEGRLDDPRAVAALGAAGDPGQSDAELRQMVYYALGFFGGDPAAERLRAGLNDPDRFARYNAAIALTRRGDQAAVGTLREMLSASDLEKLLTLPSKLEKENKIEAIELEALQALQVAAGGGHRELVEAVRPQVEALSRSGLVGVRNQALGLLRAGGGRGER